MSSISRTTLLYAVRANTTSRVKIGVTDNLTRRLQRMQAECPHELKCIAVVKSDRAYDMEYWVHQTLCQKRIQGEWFSITNEVVISVIQQVQEMERCGDLPIAPPSQKIRRRQPTPAAPSRAIMLDIFKTLRKYEMPREEARAMLRLLALPLDNNLWKDAAPPPPEAPPERAPISGRPLPAGVKFHPDDPELEYRPL